jgi:hypothetical protein
MKQAIRMYAAVVAVTVLAAAGCGRGAQSSNESAPAAGGTASSTGEPATPPVTEYPRPEKPSKAYRIGVSIPHLANPHYVGQA